MEARRTTRIDRLTVDRDAIQEIRESTLTEEGLLMEVSHSLGRVFVVPVPTENHARARKRASHARKTTTEAPADG